MANKKQYYELDEIGFIGTQQKRTATQVKKDIEKTVQYIKATKSTKRTTRKRNLKRLLKIKSGD